MEDHPLEEPQPASPPSTPVAQRSIQDFVLLTQLWVQLRFTTPGVRNAQVKHPCSSVGGTGAAQQTPATPMRRR